MYLLDQIDTCDQVHAKIYEGPLNALPCILFLFEDEHVVIEELLQLLVGEVDTELLEAVELFESKKQACVCVYHFLFFLPLDTSF